MLTKEQLMAMGASEEVANKILEANKATMEGFVPKHRFDEVNTELKSVKDQVKERDTQIAGLKKFEGDAQAFQTKITELETANKDKDTQYQKELSVERKRTAVKLALLEDAATKPHDTDMVMGLFNIDNITLDEAGKITAGFKEQNESIRKEKPFLFAVKEAAPGKPGFKVTGSEVKDGEKTPPADNSESYGKSLAQIKLGMMGVKPAAPTAQ